MLSNARIEIFQNGSNVIEARQITETIVIPEVANFPDLNPTRFVHYLEESPFIDNDHAFVISGFLKTLNSPGLNEYRLSYDFDLYTKDGVEFNVDNGGETITIQYWGMGSNVRKENLYKELFLSSREQLNISLDSDNPPKIETDFMCQVVSNSFLVQNIFIDEEKTFTWNTGLFPAKEIESKYYLFVNFAGQFGVYKDTGSNAPTYINRRLGWYDVYGKRVVARFEVLHDGSVVCLKKYWSDKNREELSEITNIVSSSSVTATVTTDQTKYHSFNTEKINKINGRHQICQSISINNKGTLNIGDIVMQDNSNAFGEIVAIRDDTGGNYTLFLLNIKGTFNNTDNLKVNGVNQATATNTISTIEGGIYFEKGKYKISGHIYHQFNGNGRAFRLFDKNFNLIETISSGAASDTHFYFDFITNIELLIDGVVFFGVCSFGNVYYNFASYNSPYYTPMSAKIIIERQEL